MPYAGCRAGGSFIIEGKSRGDLDTDRQLVLSLVKEVEIIGEAAYRLSDESRGEFPRIPWQDIIGMRHRLVHAYFEINIEILWQTINKDLPELLAVLETSLPPAED